MKALTKQIAQQPALLDNKSSNPNSIRLGLRASLTDAKASLQPLQTQIATTSAQLKEAQSDTSRLPDLEQKLEELTNAHDAAAQQAALFSSKLVRPFFAGNKRSTRPHMSSNPLLWIPTRCGPRRS